MVRLVFIKRQVQQSLASCIYIGRTTGSCEFKETHFIDDKMAAALSDKVDGQAANP